jgi:DeoR family transcriptional regulator, glycerol-3-phosphate regulon repressor
LGRGMNLFAEERLKEIVRILKQEGKVKVKELSLQFDVTEDCIRKDLRLLENQGYLKRTYGGAVQVRESAKEHDVLPRREVNQLTKNIIAKKSYDLIKDRETIFLDISTTNILLAKLLAEGQKRVTVITNMLEIINTLSSENNITVISTGGVLNKNLDGFTGVSAIDFISRYKFDKAFIGSCGVDVFDRSITTFDIDDGVTKKAVIEAGKRNYIVMESKKFYMDGNYKFATIEDIDCIVVDELPTGEVLSVLNEFNIELI